jgi:FlaG/FlaF family flagellin (archaellin)
MRKSSIHVDEGAVSSTVGVVLIVAVTVILVAAVEAFVLGIAGESTKQTPSASMELEWGTKIIGSDSYDTVDITMPGGDGMKSAFVSVLKGDGTTICEDGTVNSLYTGYDPSKTWDASKIQSGDTLRIRETRERDFTETDTVKVIWNNSQKSQILGSGTLN